MLLIDDREKPDILNELCKFRDMPHVVQRLESADCRFSGRGADGECIVGCERKKLGDLIESMKKRRLSGHQLREMIKEHDHVFLFAEGMWRAGKTGEIEEWKSGSGGLGIGRAKRESGWYPVFTRGERFAVNYRQVISYLTTLELLGGIIVRRTATPYETAAQYVALYQWFNGKDWKDHKSHDQVYTNQPGRMAALSSLAKREDPNECLTMAMQLPGIDEKAKAIVEHFGSVRAFANGTVRDWQEIKGIGKKLAEVIVERIRKDHRRVR